jgi:hypothetical protein
VITEEPHGLVWINNVNMSTFGSLVSNLCWFIGSVMLTFADYRLLMAETELARQAGIFLAGILVTAWTGKTVAGVIETNNKRKTNPAYASVIKAKTEGEVAGAAAAAVLSEAKKDAASARTTREHRADGESNA